MRSLCGSGSPRGSKTARALILVYMFTVGSGLPVLSIFVALGRLNAIMRHDPGFWTLL